LVSKDTSENAAAGAYVQVWLWVDNDLLD